jgi:predicted ArsR family transcriptional regulator
VDQRDPDAAIAAVAALADRLPRTLYRFVAAQDHAVSRDEAAAAAGASRSAAAFHLDRLVDRGLLETEFRRLSGRAGPGAGRPSKLYRRAVREVALSLPARHYDVVAKLLASAVTESAGTGAPVRTTLERLARQRGAELAAAFRQKCDPRSGRATQVLAAAEVLADQGYEPRAGERSVVLANCPFRALATGHPELVCGMNVALLEGFAGALPEARLSVRLEPSPERCCVRLDVKPSIEEHEQR